MLACSSGDGALGNRGDEISVNGQDGDKILPTVANLFLKILTEVAVATEAGCLFQYYTTLTEKAAPLLWWWLVHWSTLVAPMSTKRKKQVRINVKETHEYLEFGNVVIEVLFDPF